MLNTEKDRIVRFWDKHAYSYTSLFGHGFYDRNEAALWNRILLNNIPSSIRGRALDLGTGPGMMALLLAGQGFEVTGLDLSEEMLKLAREQSSAAGLNIDFRQGDAEDPPFPQNSFDLIICRHIMWTLPDLKTALQRWRHLLKPGGGLAITDGVWYPRTLEARLRRLAAFCLETVKTGKPPANWRKEYPTHKSVLPYVNGVYPDTIANALRLLDFTAVKHDHLEELLDYERNNAPLEYRIQFTHNPRYLVFGQKIQTI